MEIISFSRKPDDQTEVANDAEKSNKNLKCGGYCPDWPDCILTRASPSVTSLNTGRAELVDIIQPQKHCSLVTENVFSGARSTLQD